MDNILLSKQNEFDISVIIPIYNVEDFLEQCLDSVANQTKDKLEVIMIDDGSTDSSGQIADKYAEKYDNFKCLHIENGGLGHARNYAVDFAHGKYIIFLDSDDIVVPDAYEKMYCLAEKHGSDMAICNVIRFNSAKQWQSDLHNRAFRNAETLTHITKNHDLLYDTTSWNKLIRLDFWKKHNFKFPENILYEDIPVTIPMHYYANSVCVVQSVGYLWRVRDNASKSITQNASDLKNLVDRITIAKMLDEFFETKVDDESLKFDNNIKVLEIDLIIFINNCLNMKVEQAKETLKILRDYINSNINKEAIKHAAFIRRSLIESVLDDDLERIYALLSYKVNDYYFNPLVEKDGELHLKLASDLFDKEYALYNEEISHFYPRIYINKIRAEEGCINLDSHIYFNRLNIPSSDDQKIEAYLYNEFEDTAQELEVVPYENKTLTSSNGRVYNKQNGEGADYNYNGTGFTVRLDLNRLSFDSDSRSNVIIIKYKNRFVSGIAPLRNMSHGNEEWANDLSVLRGDTVLRLSVGAMKTPLVFTEKLDCFMTGYECKADTLEIQTDNENAELFAVSNENQGDRFELENLGKGVFSAPVSKLTDANEYSLFAKTGGKTHNLVREKKSGNTLHSPDYALIIRSNKTHNVNICKTARSSYIKNVNSEGNIITFDTISAGSFDTALYKSAKVGVYDSITGNMVYFSESQCKASKGRIKCKFSIDFNNEELKKDLYHSRRDLLIDYISQDGKTVSCKLYSSKHFKTVLHFDTLDISLQRAMSLEARMFFELKWREEESSEGKRKSLMNKNYPEYRREPLNEKMILFESMWGNKYSCNPMALYEYIDRHHPEYECVWSFKDPRTPIKGNGKRVRRGSNEYYKVLATTKYLVNNVNFEDDYVKREGQIEIQTMHGTPLKTLGLDVEEDFPTPEIREKYIEKNSRWDHLIVQGSFMEELSYRCFMFDKNVLKTGYPRTDILFEKINTKKIKEQLGIPLGKKIILYVPTWRVRDAFDMQLELEKMRAALSDEYVLLIRLHHFCAKGYEIPADNEFIFDLNKYSSVEDLYKITDILITDYSSVMFDFALLGKPIMFYVYDIDTYSGATRGVYFDIRKEAPGPILYTTDEIINAVLNIKEEMKKCSERASQFREKYLTYENANSCKQVVDTVIKPNKLHSAIARIKRPKTKK